MSKLSKYYTMAAMMAVLAMDKEHYMTSSTEMEAKIKCGMCKYCPKNGKRFCSKVKHNVTANTPAYKCDYFEGINENESK